MISDHCPNLTNLHLGMCGRIKDADLKKIVDGCPSLKSLELDGPFLCTDIGMSQLSKLSDLESFAISTIVVSADSNTTDAAMPVNILVTGVISIPAMAAYLLGI